MCLNRERVLKIKQVGDFTMSGIEHKMQTAPARSLLKTWKAVGQRGKRDGSNRPFLMKISTCQDNVNSIFHLHLQNIRVSVW